MQDGHQVKCLADKYKYLQSDEYKKTENGTFTYDRLCLYKRRKDWLADKTTQEKIEHARSQLFPNIGICLEDDSNNPEDLENIIEQLVNLDYPKNKVKVVICSDFKKTSARIPAILGRLRSIGISCSAVFIISKGDVFENETSVFKKLAKATFLTKISSFANIDLQRTVNEINKKSNDELKQLLVFKSGDSYFINTTYVSRSYLDHQDYRKMEEAIVSKVTNTEYLYTII